MILRDREQESKTERTREIKGERMGLRNRETGTERKRERLHNITRKYRADVNLNFPYSEAYVPRALQIIKYLPTQYLF